MLRKPKLYNEDFLNEVGSFKDISKLKNLGVANPAPQNDFDASGTQFPETKAVAPIEFGDVRKNESPYFKLGKYLGSEQTQEQQQPNLMQPPEPILTPQTEQQGFDPSQISKYAGGIAGAVAPDNFYKSLSGISGYLNTSNEQPEMNAAPQATSSPEMQQIPQPVEQLGNQVPNVNAPQMEMQAPKVPVSPGNDLMNQINTGIQQKEAEGKPPFFAAPQAIETALENPEYKSILDDLYGKEVDSDTMKSLKDYQDALTEEVTSKNTEIAGIQKRIDEHTLTTQDKVMLGLVLLAPAIIGGLIAGKEGLIKALGGGLEGLATGLQAREEGHLENIEKLSKAKEAKSDIQLKRVKADEAVLDAIPNAGLKKALKGRAIEEVVDPSGNVEAYGISTPDPNLFIDATKIHNEADLKRFDEKDVPEMKDTNALTLQINDALDDADYILDQLKKITPAEQILGEKAPFLAKTVMTREGDLINASEALDTVNEILKDRYSKTTKSRGMTEEVVKHFKGLLSSPYGEESVWKGRNLNTIISKTRQFRGLMNKAHERSLESSGFLVQPFKKKIGESESVQQAAQERKSNLAMDFLRKNPKAWEKAQKGEFVGGK